MIKYLFFLFILISCAQKEEDSFNADLNYSIIGSANFGNVRIGEYRYAEVEVSNNTGESQNVTIDDLFSPFYIEDNKCGLLKQGDKCRIKFRFTPSSNFTQSQTVFINKFSFDLSGKGLALGVLSINSNAWNFEDVLAGSAITKSFIITNVGDISLDKPFISEGDAIISNTNCQDKIFPLSSCSIELTVQKTLVSDYNEIIKLKGAGSEEILINFAGNIIPNVPSGIITFTENIDKVIANSADIKTIIISEVTDEYGNIITSGYNVEASAINLSIISSNQADLENGSASFTIRSTSVIGSSQFFVSIGDASGIMNIYSSSGPSVGTINVKTLNSILKADGFSSVIVETLPLVNSAGLTVDDGTEVVFEIEGSGSLSNIISPTISGVARTRITSSNVAETITLHILSNPVYNDQNQVIDYISKGSVEITFIPVDDVSDFNLYSNHSGIYFEKGTSFYIDEANITSSVIMDIHSNPVGEGRIASVTITNGLNSINNQESFDVMTNGQSKISFSIKGISQRGFITISTDVNGTSSILKVFATSEAQLSFTPSNNPVSVYHTYSSYNFNTNSLHPNENKWKEHNEDYSALMLRDTEYFGKKRFSYPTKEIFYNFFDFVDECMIPVKSYFLLSPCTKKVINNSALDYREEALYKVAIDKNAVYYDTNVQFPFYSEEGFDNFILGVTSLFDYKNDSIIKFGGLVIDEYGDFFSNSQSLVYSQASLFVHLPMELSSFSYSHPLIPSISHGEKTYIFGGAILESTPLVSFSNNLYLFENGNLNEISIPAGSDKPSERILNGIYHYSGKVFVAGGIAPNGSNLTDLWQFDELTSQWTELCDNCFQENLIDPFVDINSFMGSPSKDKLKDVVMSNRIQLIYDEIKDSLFLSWSNSSNVQKFNFNSNTFSEEYDLNIKTIFASEKVYYNRDRKNYLKYDNRTEGGGDSKVTLFEMDRTEVEYYLIKIQSDENAKSYVQRITPKISGWNNTIFEVQGSTIERFGLSSYIYNHDDSIWEFIDTNSHPVKDDILNENYDMSKNFETNPSKFFSDTGEIHILIKPDNVGELDGTPYNFSSEVLLNYLEINGIF